MAKTNDLSTKRITRCVSFQLGTTVMTPGAQDALSPDDIRVALARHAGGDWGDLPQADRDENEHSLREGFRILSAYRSTSGVSFWVITEADRSATTVLLPEEY